MQMILQKLSALIEHFKAENLQKENRCFYCGGLHKTVICESDKRKAFHLSLDTLGEKDQGQETETIQRQDMYHSYKQVEKYATDLNSSLWQELV